MYRVTGNATQMARNMGSRLPRPGPSALITWLTRAIRAVFATPLATAAAITPAPSRCAPRMCRV